MSFEQRTRWLSMSSFLIRFLVTVNSTGGLPLTATLPTKSPVSNVGLAAASAAGGASSSSTRPPIRSERFRGGSFPSWRTGG